MKRSLCLLALAGTLISQTLWAQSPGDLDASFNTTGWWVDWGGADADLNAAGMLPDGRIVTAGVYDYFNDHSLWITRRWPDGTLDTGFDGDGIAVVSGYFVESDKVDLAMQQDGKVLVACHASDLNGYYCLIARLDTVGNLDATFGQGGLVVEPESSVAYGFEQVHVQSSGRILVTAHGGTVLSITAFTPTGQRDNTYGPFNGQVVLPIANADEVVLEGSGLMPSGELTLLAESRASGPRSVHLVRVDDDGDLVAGYGTGGMVTVADTFYYSPSAFAVAPTGEAYVGGMPPSWTGNLPVAVRRYTATGTLDNAWGQSGTALVTAAGHLHAWTMMVASNGLVYLAGDHDAGPTDIMVARLTPAGQADPAFGMNGVATDLTAGGMIWAYDIVEQPDGKVVVAGVQNNVSTLRGFMARFLTSPALSADAGAAESLSVGIFPNPASDHASLLLDVDQDVVVDVCISDLSGRTCRDIARGERLATGSHVLDLRVADLPSGLYEVLVRADGQQLTGRLVVTH